MPTNNSLACLTRTPLHALLSSALVLGPMCAQSALAAVVTNCANSGTGSLRSAIAATASGGTVTFSAALPACTITLTTSSIPVSATNLTIKGPVSNSFTVSGGQNYRIFSHSGSGTLTIEHLALVDGKYKGSGLNAKGGCILSNGSVSLSGSSVSGCIAYTDSATGKTRGGAIYAKGAVTVVNTTVSGNTALAFQGVYGGAINALSLDAQYSTFDSNYATFPTGKLPAEGSVFEGGAVHVSGTTSIIHSTLTNNKANGANNDHNDSVANGGCVFGTGAMYIGASTVAGCFAGSYNKTQGGGIFAAAALTLSHSIVTDNYGAGTNGSFGGGLRAGSLLANDSTIHGNLVSSGPYGFSGQFEGGGIFIYDGSTQLTRSSLDGNDSVGAGGGLFTVHSNITVNDSTVSGNRAFGNGSDSTASGGIQMAGASATLHISNSTIAFNRGSGGTNAWLGGGLRAFGTAVIQSSIIARNTMGDTDASDVSCDCGTNAVKTISGANNLIMVMDPGAVAPPPGMVISTADPKLVPLGNHGGETQTHALIAGSPALGVGNNLGNFTTDQRGAGFPRLNGGFVDIGAYERQPNDDEIFYSGVE